MTTDTIPVIDKAIAGDTEAFGDLYRQYADQVFNYCYYRVATRQLAEDLCADTFVRALRSVAGYEHRGTDFGAWLFTIARNIINDHYKRSRTRRETLTFDGEIRDGDDVEPAVDETVLVRARNTDLHAAVQRLNDLQRTCVTLRFLQGLSIAETATALDSNERAIKTLQYRAVKNLTRDPRLRSAIDA